MLIRCQHCGSPVHRKGAKYCSYRCAGLARQHYKTCVICGKRYPCAPTNAVLTCGPECSAKLRRQQAIDNGNAANLDEQRRIWVASVKPQDRPTAKTWTLRAPDGVTYTCKNLIQFFRDHENLIDGTPEQAARGIVVVKSTMTGVRRKNRCYHWKGWSLLSWDDCGVKPRTPRKDK